MVPNDEVIKRLRARGEPIRLFGETDRQRMNRLRLLESQDADQPGEAGQANEFRRAMEATEQRLVKEALQKQAGLEDDDEKRRRAAEDALLDSVDTSPISLQLLQEDEDRNIYLVSVFFRRLLRDWGRAMDRMPDEQKRSREGKLLQTNYRQSQEFLQPFFRRLKTKTIEADVLARVTEMAVYLQQREYQKANNQYLQLSIGNAPWPIGVTMVGIHERSGREKIFASKVAHVLNDEATRKWIQSLKRVMTWAQEEYPPDDVSKRMG
ncbi:Prp18 domain-containing protein [Hyaloraphidium curvatum]|nr:Prp18 domain-containing protein [Hyaloraphidium curvatum]